MGRKVLLAGTVLVQMYLVVSSSVLQRAAHDARSVLTGSAQQKEKVGVATTESRRLPYLRVLASLTALVLLLLAPPTLILHVLVANHWSPRFPVKIMVAPNSGTGWGPVSMFPMQTGKMWMADSTSVFPVFLASVVQLHAVSAFRRNPVPIKGVPDSLVEPGRVEAFHSQIGSVSPSAGCMEYVDGPILFLGSSITPQIEMRNFISAAASLQPLFTDAAPPIGLTCSTGNGSQRTQQIVVDSSTIGDILDCWPLPHYVSDRARGGPPFYSFRLLSRYGSGESFSISWRTYHSKLRLVCW